MMRVPPTMRDEYHVWAEDKPRFNLLPHRFGRMAYDAGALDATLAAAAGEDHELLVELRAAFVESLDRQIDLLRRARCDGNWHVAAMRLRGLGASFNVAPLMELADHAMDTAPGDPAVVRRLQAFLDEFTSG